MTQDEQRQAEESRVYDHDGSVRPSRDTGYRVGMPWRDFVPSDN